MSRYIIFFQLSSYADRRVARHDFAYLGALRRRWAPGFTVPAGHLAYVKRTLAASMPAPVAMYRGGGLAVAEQDINVPTYPHPARHSGPRPGASSRFTGHVTTSTTKTPSTVRTRSGPRVLAEMRNLAVGAIRLTGRGDITETTRQAAGT